ncbi:hypothetical protein [Methyloraptor flagellatus]|uniref:Uncharacterized protein n=1 Tax=Methyloraptor flagellatus TaxID=3162530 RepID=A0AAU7XC09_9HYPH
MAGTQKIVEISYPESLPKPINTLHEQILLACIAMRLAAQLGIGEHESPFDQLSDADEVSDLSTEPAVRVREINAIQRTVEALTAEGFDVVYIDNLSYMHNGIDVVAKDRGHDIFVLAEVKATSKPIRSSLRTYLRSTKYKGRQLTRAWCWASTIETFSLGSSARTFLRLFRAVIEGRIERRLYVWSAEDDVGQLPDRPVQHRIWREADLIAHAEFDDTIDPQWSDWLREIDDREPESVALWSDGLAR